MTFPIQKTDAQWLDTLQAKGAEPVAYQVTRHAATERPFTGKYEQHWAPGSYHCICCGAKLFDSDTKFDAGCGWPSFYQADPGAITEIVDRSHHMVRTETVCSQCGAHLGHVFEDGPLPTGLRYCMNSASLDFHAPDSSTAAPATFEDSTGASNATDGGDKNQPSLGRRQQPGNRRLAP